eukprot:3729338-Pleurochrysis_carterae.AAC.2
MLKHPSQAATSRMCTSNRTSGRFPRIFHHPTVITHVFVVSPAGHLSASFVRFLHIKRRCSSCAGVQPQTLWRLHFRRASTWPPAPRSTSPSTSATRRQSSSATSRGCRPPCAASPLTTRAATWASAATTAPSASSTSPSSTSPRSRPTRTLCATARPPQSQRSLLHSSCLAPSVSLSASASQAAEPIAIRVLST